MISFRGILSKLCEQKISTRQRKPSAYFLPLEEQHGQDEERTHEADRGGVRLIYIWQMTLTLIEFQEGVHFRRKGGAVVFGNAPPFTANAIP